MLGRDAETGEAVPGFAPARLAAEDWRAMTAEPRRYGFHATLKAPFRLSARAAAPTNSKPPSRQLAAVVARLRSRPAARVHACGFSGGGFVALTPARRSPALRELEARAVRELDAFRAPLTEDGDRSAAAPIASPPASASTSTPGVTLMCSTISACTSP